MVSAQLLPSAEAHAFHELLKTDFVREFLAHRSGAK